MDLETREPENTGTERTGRRRSLIALAAGVVLGVAALAVAAMLLAAAVGGSAHLEVEAGIPVEVAVPPGASARTIAAVMEDAGVVSASELRDEISRRSVADQLKAGRYSLETGMSAAAVVDLLVTGPNVDGAETISIREGLTIVQVLDSLAEQTGYPASAFRQALLDGSVTSPYLPDVLPAGVDPLAAWEGLLFPAKYQITQGATPAQILTTLANEMIDRVESLDWSRAAELQVSRYEVLVVASIIEREAAVDEDRPLIASVIYNRLAQQMPLQIDSTVIYALGENPGRVLSEHLDVDSPYNTYRNSGLPPTPIGTIRQASLEAAVDPASTDYLFYVLISKDGHHGFSATYEEHQQKVAQAKADGVIP